MGVLLEFLNREAFREWLAANCLTSAGVWLLFGKAGGPKTLTANEALEEALCFGWIDGQMQKIDEKGYKKYFAMRREKSKWSAKNKALAEKLEKSGAMTEYGRKKMEEAKTSGQWDAKKSPEITQKEISDVEAILSAYEPAHSHFKAMAPSVQKTYTRAYLDAKTEAGREKRLAWMVERLNQNLKPM